LDSPPSGRRDDAFILAPGAWLDRLENDEMVVGASPTVGRSGPCTYGKVAMGISLVGSEPERQKSVSNIEKRWFKGNFRILEPVAIVLPWEMSFSKK
jgi:ABC-type lipoprotein release transport system permease subunit